MKSFGELEKERQSAAVQTTETINGAGVLSLSGNETLLTLSTSELFHAKTDVNGWFDLSLRRGDEIILLHNALIVGQTTYGFSGACETEIFPNEIVFGAGAIGKSLGVRAIQFRVEGLGNFFTHRILEFQSLHNAKKNVLDAIRALRKSKKGKLGIKYDFYKPMWLHLVHHPSRILSFSVSDRRFELYWGLSSRGAAGNAIDVSVEPTATIRFSKQKTIDEATDEVWCWRRLFRQLAMESLEITGLSVTGTKKKSLPADMYLSNTPQKKDGGRRAFRKGQTPFAGWKERKKLADAMGKWLSMEDKRRTFRVCVDRVLDHQDKGSTLEDIVTLCSGVESLSDLAGSTAVTKGNLKKISDAAIKCALEEKVSLDPQRIRSILQMLKYQSLPQRLKALMDSVAPAVSSESAAKIIKGSLSLRTLAAHGGSVTNLTIPRIRPLVSALTGVCVLYDLITSGFPTQVNAMGKIRAMKQISDALEHLAHLEANAL